MAKLVVRGIVPIGDPFPEVPARSYTPFGVFLVQTAPRWSVRVVTMPFGASGIGVALVGWVSPQGIHPPFPVPAPPTPIPWQSFPDPTGRNLAHRFPIDADDAATGLPSRTPLVKPPFHLKGRSVFEKRETRHNEATVTSCASR